MKLEHGVCFKFTQTNKKDEPSYPTSHFKNSMVPIEIWIVPPPFVPASARCLDSWAYDAAVTLYSDAGGAGGCGFLFTTSAYV